MKILLHGTTIESALEIMKSEQFKASDRIWKKIPRSNDVYFRVYDPEDLDIAKDEMKQVIDSAQVAAAYRDSKYRDVAIIRLKIDDDAFEQYFGPDKSAPNMHPRCVAIDADVLNDLIFQHQVDMLAKICENAYEPLLRPYYIYSLNLDYFEYPDNYIEYVCECMRRDPYGLQEWLNEYFGDYEIRLEAMPALDVLDPSFDMHDSISLIEAMKITNARNETMILNIEDPDGMCRRAYIDADKFAARASEMERNLRVVKIDSASAPYSSFVYQIKDASPELISDMIEKYTR